MYTIYGKDSCPFCVKAVALCESKGLSFQYKKLGVDLSKEEMFEVLGREVRTVPQITMGEMYIGGYDQFKKYVE